MGALINRGGSVQQGWTHNAAVSDGVSLVVQYERKATSTASVDWEVHVAHSSSGNAAVQLKSASSYLATFTIVDLGLDV